MGSRMKTPRNAGRFFHIQTNSKSRLGFRAVRGGIVWFPVSRSATDRATPHPISGTRNGNNCTFNSGTGRTIQSGFQLHSRQSTIFHSNLTFLRPFQQGRTGKSNIILVLGRSLTGNNFFPFQNRRLRSGLQRADFTHSTGHLGTGGVVLVLRDGNGGQDADDRDHDHQFDQSKTLLSFHEYLHVVCIGQTPSPSKAGCMPTFQTPSFRNSRGDFESVPLSPAGNM